MAMPWPFRRAKRLLPRSENRWRMRATPRKSGSVAEAAGESEVLFLATPWEAVQNALASAGDLTGRMLIDATNPLLPDLTGLAVSRTTSAGEMVAKWAAGAKVVKAFNTVGFNIMADPRFEGTARRCFYCGDDAKAKAAVCESHFRMGFEALAAGPLT
jgi:predicted dinucleotide-binding enzyme